MQCMLPHEIRHGQATWEHLKAFDEKKQMIISAQTSVSEAHTSVCLPEAPDIWGCLEVPGSDSHPAEEGGGWGQDPLQEEVAQTS